MKDVIEKVLDSGLIQKVEKLDDSLLLSFAFEANYLGTLYFYNHYQNTFYDDDLYPEIRYFGSLLVDYNGNVIKGILDSIIFENYDKSKSEKKMTYNKTQMINKLDRINLSRMFNLKEGFILPYCSTNSTLVWKDCIKVRNNKCIFPEYESGTRGFQTIWRHIGRDEFITYDLLEKKCNLENYMVGLENKLKCAKIIGKSIISSGEIMAESVGKLGEDIIQAGHDISGTMAYKDMQPIINIKH